MESSSQNCWRLLKLPVLTEVCIVSAAAAWSQLLCKKPTSIQPVASKQFWALQLPRNLALAPVALQATWLDHDPHGAAASTDIMAVGALLKLELLALPPAPVHIKNWTLHQPLDQPGKLKLHR